jgi:hypothetical protein
MFNAEQNAVESIGLAEADVVIITLVSVIAQAEGLARPAGRKTMGRVFRG